MRGWRSNHWPALVAACVAGYVAVETAVTVAVATFADPLKRTGQTVLDNSSLASWVQAVGSIGTIAVGVWAVLHQLRNQRRDAVAREKERIFAGWVLLYHRAVGVLAMYETSIDKLKAGLGNWHELAANAENERQAFNTLTPADLPTPHAIGAIDTMTTTLFRSAERARANLTISGTAKYTAIQDTLLSFQAAHARVVKVSAWIDSQIIESDSALFSRFQKEQRAYLDELAKQVSPYTGSKSQTPPPPAAGSAPTAAKPPPFRRSSSK